MRRQLRFRAYLEATSAGQKAANAVSGGRRLARRAGLVRPSQSTAGYAPGASWRSLTAVVLSLALLVGAGTAGFTTNAAHTYVVQPGDSLWAISRANGLTVSQLAAANDMGVNDLLLIGRQLYIPSDDQPTAVAAPSASSTKGSATPDPWTFCSTFAQPGSAWGVLPQLLQQSPNRLALQPLFMQWASYYDLSLPLLEAIAWQESGWQQGVTSSAGAVGTGQIMPGTASFISSSLIGLPMNINSVSDNIRMSAAFLAYLAGVEGNNQCSTIAAYYEGPLNLSEYGVFPETQAYVANVEALIPEFE
jgi:LysM repeat protein